MTTKIMGSTRLVLTRRHSESITVDGPATITIVRCNGPVRLAIEAPKTTRVLRSELGPHDKEKHVGPE